MGNQCCSAADRQVTNNEEGGQSTENYGNNPGANVHSKNVGEQNDSTIQRQFTEAKDIDMKQEQTTQQEKKEDQENNQVVDEYVFKKQIDNIKNAIKKVEDLLKINEYSKTLTIAISQLEFVIYTLSQSIVLPSNIANVKSDILIGLYGDLQNFRSFHIRYTVESKYIDCLGAIDELYKFIKEMTEKHTKDRNIDYKELFTNLTKGDDHSTFQEIITKLENIRTIHNSRPSGINMSTLPNYLYLIFFDQPGFNLWEKLFPNEFEVSIDYFSEKYSEACSVAKDKIFNIIFLLDTSNDRRVDIYQWMDFVKSNEAVLDKDGKINSTKIDAFQSDIQKKANALKKPPTVVEGEENIYKLPSGMIYKGSLDTQNLRQGKGKLEDTVEEYLFEGTYKDDLPDGQGIEFRKKVKYEGEFLKGLYHGKGKLVFPNGRMYIGSFMNHFFNGQGEFTNEDGVKYSGYWEKNTLKSATVIYPDGSKYIGELTNNFFKHGSGIYSSAGDVLTYDGKWSKDTPSTIKIAFKGVIIYEGTMENYNISGKGKRFYPDGTYDGLLQRDKKHGQGNLIYSKEGGKYEGKWEEDLQLNGTYTYNSNEKFRLYQGDWKNGVPEGKGKFVYRHGGTYEGEVKEGKRHGKGTQMFSCGNKYEGYWHENNQHGDGKFTFAAEGSDLGDVFQGQFKKGKLCGFGHYIYRKSGKQYIGYWENDKWHGHGKLIDKDHLIIKCGQWKEDAFEREIPEEQLHFPDNWRNYQIQV